MSLGKRITGLLFVLMACFSVTAHAYDLSTFRLRCEDPYTGVGRVLTDNVTAGLLNSAGDRNLAPGTIYFSGLVENFLVTVQATSTTANPDGSGGGVLTLSGSVTYSGLSNAQIVITLEDSGYTAPATTAAFVDSVGGYNTPLGNLTGATSVKFQSWLDIANNWPAFGPVSGSTYLNSMITPSTSTAAFYGDGQLFTTTGYAYTGVGVPVVFGGNYSMYSQATVNFSGNGSADFSVTATTTGITPGNPVPLPTGTTTPGNPVPEPTSLMLLGAALLGLGVLPMNKHI